MSFGGFGNIGAPDLQSPDLTPLLENKGGATASKFGSQGMINSTNLNQAWTGDVLSNVTQQADQNNRLAQQMFQDQLLAQEQPNSLAQLAGLIGL